MHTIDLAYVGRGILEEPIDAVAAELGVASVAAAGMYQPAR